MKSIDIDFTSSVNQSLISNDVHCCDQLSAYVDAPTLLPKLLINHWLMNGSSISLKTVSHCCSLCGSGVQERSYF